MCSRLYSNIVCIHIRIIQWTHIWTTHFITGTTFDRQSRAISSSQIWWWAVTVSLSLLYSSATTWRTYRPIQPISPYTICNWTNTTNTTITFTLYYDMMHFVSMFSMKFTYILTIMYMYPSLLLERIRQGIQYKLRYSIV